jgi:hypothetical protein
MMNITKSYFLKHWSKQTSHSDEWSQQKPSKGQCAISSIAIQDLLGGDIAKIRLPDGQSHYFNLIGGNIYDITDDQFGDAIEYNEYDICDRSELLHNRNTELRYKIFTESLFGEINDSLPKDQIEHIAIRDPNYVAGTSEKPEVKVFCQTNKNRRPLNDEKLFPNQNVYMKWKSGPIVAKSKLVSWHSGKFKNSDINKLRELTVGSKLFGLTDYWSSVAIKKEGCYSVIHLNSENWMENLLYSSIRSFGSSWIYLDTIKKKIQWLSLDLEPVKELPKSRNIPASLRFNVLRRDNYTCQYCGRSAPDVELHIDHKVPWKIVKEHNIENLVVSCRDCNLGKSDKLI